MDTKKKINLTVSIISLIQGIIGILYYTFFRLDLIGVFAGLFVLIIGCMLLLGAIITEILMTTDSRRVVGCTTTPAAQP